MYKIIKQRLYKNMILNLELMIVNTEKEAHEIVQSIRKRENNQLCYYKEIK